MYKHYAPYEVPIFKLLLDIEWIQWYLDVGVWYVMMYVKDLISFYASTDYP